MHYFRYHANMANCNLFANYIWQGVMQRIHYHTNVVHCTIFAENIWWENNAPYSLSCEHDAFRYVH